MDDECLEIIGLMQQLYLPNNDVGLINDAAQKLEQFFQSPQSLMTVIQIAHNVPDLDLKKSSITNILSLLKRHHDSLPPDAFETINPQLIELLHSEIDINSRMILSDILCMFYENYKVITFEELHQVSLEMLQSQNQYFIPIGLYLISILIDKDHLSYFQIDTFQSLISISLQFLQEPEDFDIPSFHLFRIAYRFFNVFISCIDLDESLEAAFEPVIEYLQKMYQFIYTPDNIRNKDDSDLDVKNKISKYFRLLSSIASSHQEMFLESFGSIIPEINANLINKELDIDTRLSSLSVLASAALALPYVLYDDFNTYIMNTAAFAIELFQTYEDLQMLYQPNDIYKSLCKNMREQQEEEDGDESSAIFEKFTPVINELNSADDPCALIAIFMILDSIQDYCINAIIEEFDSIQELFVKGISSGEPIILEIVATLIESFCKSDSSIACTILSVCEPVLIQFTEHDFVVDALKEIYDYSEREPLNQKDSMSSLLSQLDSTDNSVHIEKVIECISYLILTIESEPDQIEQYFEAINPYLIQLLQTNDTTFCAPAIFCFSAFASKCATLVRGFIPQIVEIIISGASEQDINFNDKAATVIQNFVDIYPRSFAEFCPQVVSALISIVNDKELYNNMRMASIENYEFEDEKAVNAINDDDDEYDEEHEKRIDEIEEKLSRYDAMRDDVFIAIATIFGIYPTELAEQSNEIEQIVMSSYLGNNFDNEEEDIDDKADLLVNLRGFYASLAEVIPGFTKIGRDPENLVKLLFESFETLKNYHAHKEPAIEFWKNLKIIISRCGAPFVTKYGDEILNLVNETFSPDKNKWNLYSETENRFCLRKDFVSPITTLVSRFFHVFAENGWLADPSLKPHQFAERAVDLVRAFTLTNKSAFAQVSCTLSNIIISCGNDAQFDELTEGILNNLYPDAINSKIGDIREAAYDTIINLVYNGNAHALEMLSNQECVQNILESTQEAIGNKEQYRQSLVQSAVILWCGIVMAFNVEITKETFDVVLDFLPPPPLSPMLEYVAQFSVYAAEKWPEVFDDECLLNVGISIFATEENLIRNVRIEYMKIFAEILSRTPQEVIEELLHSDEHLMMQIQTNIEQVNAFN